MSLFRIVTKLKQKIVKPKVYVVELNSSGVSFLHLCLAYSLDEAVESARKKIRTVNKFKLIGEEAWAIGKYTSAELHSLVSDATDLNIKEGETFKSKNELMALIIKEKDVELLH